MYKRWWVLGGLCLAGCSEAASHAPDAGPAPGVVVQTEPASAADCPNGGTVVRSGLDDNGNGALDPDEVQARSLVCNDPPVQPPPPIVVRLIAEPTGVNCALGGTAVQSGPDRNGNGVLDDDEVAHSDYFCGVALRTRLVIEPPGARCPAGGVAIQVGRDRNGDGELGDDEVDHTEVSCGDELARDVVLHSALDADALASITVITGSVTIDGAAMSSLVLPQLVQVRGALAITGNTALDHISLPALQSVDGRFAVERDPQLLAIDLPVLHRVGALSIAHNVSLGDLRGMPALAAVAGDLAISDNGALRAADLPAIAIGGALDVTDNPSLAHATWSLTAAPSAVHITSNAALDSVDLAPGPSAPFLQLGGVTIASNTQLAHLSLTAGDLAFVDVHDNLALADVQLAFDAVHGDVSLRDLGARSSVSLVSSSLFGRFIGGSLTISGPARTLQLPAELAVQGDLTIDGTDAVTIGPTSQITEIAGALHLTGNRELVHLPTFSVGGGLEIRGNLALDSLARVFPAVDRELAGDLTLADNPVLHDAPSLGGLARIHGGATVASNPALKEAFGPTLVRVDGDLTFEADDGLSDLGLGSLVQVQSVAVRRCGALTELALPALSTVAAGIEIRGNAGLRQLRLPVLRRADMAVFDNPELPACGVEALFAGLLGDHHQSGNDDTAVCTTAPAGGTR